MTQEHLSIEERLSNLQKFRELWVEFANFVSRAAASGNYNLNDEATYQQYLVRISLMLPRVQQDIQRHGLSISKMIPVGGGLYRDVQNYLPFLGVSTLAPSLSDLFRFGSDVRIREYLGDCTLGDRILLQAIGTLQFAQELGGEDNLPQQQNSPSALVDVLSAIRRALRPAFRQPPNSEVEVQDQMEVILRAQGIEFERESQIQHATKKVKPDFVLPALDTALEIKLCSSTRREKEIIEEIGADIVAYRKQYSITLFVIYDVATIADKDSFLKGFANETGVLIEIVS